MSTTLYRSQTFQAIRVVIADDHPMVRSGLQTIIDAAPGMQVTGHAVDGASTLARLQDTACDVLLLDLGMPPPSGPELIARIHADKPGLPVVVITMHEEIRLVRAALQAGAKGYITKDTDPDTLVQAVRDVAAGRRYVDPRLAQAMAFAPDSAPHEKLSPREFEVMRRLAAGQSNGEIARHLFLSEKTVSTHKANVLAKLELHSMADLIRYVDQNLNEADGQLPG